MKHNLVNFTRGSQLLGHFGFMFAAGLKGPLIITITLMFGLAWWEVWPAAGLVDTEIRCSVELEDHHGTKEVYARV